MRWARPSHPAPVRSLSTLGLDLVLTHWSSPILSTTAFIYAVSRHRVSPEMMGSRDFIPMAHTAKSPPAQYHYGPQGSSCKGCCLLRKLNGPFFERPSFPTSAILIYTIIGTVDIIGQLNTTVSKDDTT